MTENEASPGGQVEAASDEQIADWKTMVAPAIPGVGQLIARIEAERDRADEIQHASDIRVDENNDALRFEIASLRTEITELRELLRVARCPNQECDGGVIPVPLGEHYVTRDMAIDGGDPSLEGQSMGVEWGAEQCRWCYERDEAIEKKLSKEVGDG